MRAPKMKQAEELSMQFSVNQIVKGRVCGTFVILGFRNIDGEIHAQLKEVSPHDFSITGRGEIALPVNALVPAVSAKA